MRLRSLTLDRFGHFTGQRFDFRSPGDRPDFHIVYGPNEAGKTTTMEAVLRLFYGFPARDPYAFKHPRANLQVSGVIEIDGAERPFTRLPTRTGSLVDGAGTALPEAALSAHLGGFSEADYRSLLCLDDDTIERGGEEIANAQGDIGRLLFSAAAGVADLSLVLDGVRREADEIWRKQARKTAIAELKRDLQALEKEIRERDVTGPAWRKLRQTLAEARKDEAAARAQRKTLQSRAAENAARGRALPLLASVDRCDAEIAPFAGYPERLDFDPEDLVGLLQQDHAATREMARLDTDLAEDRAALAALERHPGLADLAAALDALAPLQARNATAAEDLDRRRTTMTQAAADMRRAANDLNLAAETDPGHLVLSPADLARLDDARTCLREAEAARRTEAAALAQARARRDTARDEANAEAPATLDADSPEIGSVLARHESDRLTTEHARARQAIAGAHEALRAALDALASGAVRFDTLPPCPMTDAQASSLADEHASCAAKIAQTEAELAGYQDDVAARSAQAAQMSDDGALVSDDAAQALMAERDALWQAHRATLSEASADTFAAAMHRLDTATRTRIVQARALEDLRQTELARAEAEARATRAAARLETQKTARAGIEAQINDAAASLGLPVPMPPGAWRAWVQRHSLAAEAEARARRTEDQYRAVLARAERLREDLMPLLDLTDPDFDALVARARDTAQAEQAHKAETSKRDQALRMLDAEVARRAKATAEFDQAVQAAASDWAEMVGDLLGDAVLPETLLADLGPLRALREHAGRRDDAALRVTQLEADRARFAKAVADLATSTAQPQDETPEKTYARMRATAEAARQAEARARDLEARISDAQEARAEQEQIRARIADNVRAMVALFPRAAGVEDLASLRTAAATAVKVIEARASRAEAEAALLAELACADINAARQTLAGVTSTTQEAEAQVIRADLEQAEDHLTQMTEMRVAAEHALAAVTGDDDIAALTERKATIEMQLEEAARGYLELSLGHRLAQEAIRRYRDAHRSAMMAATEASFAALTRGAYARLTTQPDGETETLLAVDASGTSKRVADLSKGTRFQLYLALRAAAHDQLIRQGVSLPFFCDDIFETFDEARTSAACRVMEQIGRAGQAIYLTHHRHVVDIAAEVCDTPPIVHEIG